MESLKGLNPQVLARLKEAQDEIDWLRNASALDLVNLAASQLGLKEIKGIGDGLSAIDFGNIEHGELLRLIEPHFEQGTSVAEDLADQIQLCRAFGDPSSVTKDIAGFVEEKVRSFPRLAGDLRQGQNPGDVLDPFILAANFELLSDRNLSRTIEHAASHKVLMKIEDLIGNLHQNVIGRMRGNFRIPEPQGGESKENLDVLKNPFPGADVGQVPTADKLLSLRLFQVKSKTGSAKGGDGKRLGEQLRKLGEFYKADTFYAAIVGNTLRGHRSRGAVERESPATAVLVGASALNELTQSKVGGELLLRTYQRAFRAASEKSGYKFEEIIPMIVAEFEKDSEDAGTDFLSAWLHAAIDGEKTAQDSRHCVKKRKSADCDE